MTEKSDLEFQNIFFIQAPIFKVIKISKLKKQCTCIKSQVLGKQRIDQILVSEDSFPSDIFILVAC